MNHYRSNYQQKEKDKIDSYSKSKLHINDRGNKEINTNLNGKIDDICNEQKKLFTYLENMNKELNEIKNIILKKMRIIVN